MIDLAVVNDQETFRRMRAPLEARGVRSHHVPVTERTVDLSESPWLSDEYDAGFVYPGRLMEGGVADALLGVPWLNGRDAVVTSRNKAAVLATLGREGVPVPASVYVSNPTSERDLVAAFERLEPPVVVKPNSATRGVGVAKAADLDSFLGICDYLLLGHEYRAVGDRSFLLQEYVPDARDYRVMLLDGECVGAVERRLSADALAAGRWKHNVHRGATAVGIDPPERVRELAERVASVLGIPFLGVDLFVTADRTLVNETNARPTIDDEHKYDADFYDRLATAIETTTTGS